VQEDSLIEDVVCWLILKYKPNTQHHLLTLNPGTNEIELALPNKAVIQLALNIGSSTILSVYRKSNKAFWIKQGDAQVEDRLEAELRLEAGLYVILIEEVLTGTLQLSSTEPLTPAVRAAGNYQGGYSWKNSSAIAKS
jgi:hypothetical protein